MDFVQMIDQQEARRAIQEAKMHHCECCGNAIYDGERYYNIHGIVCEACIEDYVEVCHYG